MLYVYLGGDRDAARAALNETAEADARARAASLVRITDLHSPDDVAVSLQGAGMFARSRIVVYENVLGNDDVKQILLEALQFMADSGDAYYLFEEKPDAALRKKLEKHATRVEKFDAAKGREETTAFAMANALRRRDRKALWVAYARELGKGTAPEMLHGILFWAAKQEFLQARTESARTRAERLVTTLAALPHEARRAGVELDYALEAFVLAEA